MTLVEERGGGGGAEAAEKTGQEDGWEAWRQRKVKEAARFSLIVVFTLIICLPCLLT